MSDSNVHGLGLRSSSGCCLTICCFGWLGNKLFAAGLGGLIPTYTLKKLWRPTPAPVKGAPVEKTKREAAVTKKSNIILQQLCVPFYLPVCVSQEGLNI